MQRLRIRLSDPNAVAQRQLAIAAVFFATLPTMLLPDVSVRLPRALLLASVLMLAACVASLTAPLHRPPTWLLLSIPVVDLAAMGVLRFTTGGFTSPYTILLVLPTISLGIERGRAPVVLAFVVCLAAVAVPALFVPNGLDDPSLVRLVAAPIVLLLTAITVNVLTTRLRSRIRAVQRLQRDQASLLEQAHAHAEASAASAAMLRESGHLMSSVIGAITEQAIIATDSAGRIQVFNVGAERLVGAAAQDVMGRDLVTAMGEDVEVTPLPDSAGALARDELADGQDSAAFGFQRAVIGAAGERADVSYWSYQHRNGLPVTALVSVTVRHDAAGEIDGYLFVGTDVTQAREEARMKDDFVNLISHELRTPLSSILGYLELMDDEQDNPLSAAQRQYLAIVDRNARRLLRLVGDLLFTAQVEAGRFNLDQQDVDLQTVVAAAVESAQPAAAAQRVRLALSATNLPTVVRGDPVRLGQACDNLISNAIKFTRPDGRVAVTLTVAEDTQGEPRALVSVSDTGIGIPAGELDQLFARFFRATTATLNAVPGVGLGLSITKAIASAHGGTIRVASTEGEGTTFTLDLPCEAAVSVED